MLSSSTKPATTELEEINAVLGTTVDAPSTDAEGATARTGISLWKGIKNYLRTLAACVSGTRVLTDATLQVADADASLTNPVPTRDAPFTAPVSGEIQGNAAATQFPSIACRWANIKACISNVGNVYIGVAGVTKPDGTTDTTTGFELLPGDETGWMPVDNLNRFYRICDNAGDDTVYLCLS